MNFKRTYNKDNTNTYYYVDNKRVSEEAFDNKEILCRVKGMNYNSSLLTSKGNRYTSTFSYN